MLIRLFTLVFILVASTSTFYFLALNILLAYIPIELSFQISFFKNKGIKCILGFFFILFFPNVPYLATDIIHMDKLTIYDYLTNLSSENIKLWLLTIGLFTAVFFYILTGFCELLKQLNYVGRVWHLNRFGKTILFSFLSFLFALGMYAGRFAPRFHSVDLFSRPTYVLKTIFLEWSQSKVELVALFFLLQFLIMGSILVNRSLNKKESRV